MEACNRFEDVLHLLELTKYFPCKITLRHVFEAKLSDKIELKDIKWKILNKIINVDLRARDGELSDILDKFNKQDHVEDKKSEIKQDDQTRTLQIDEPSLFHPQDVINAVYLCCSPFLKQLIVSKLFMCRIAVPVIISSTKLTEGFLWPFNFVATDGTNSNGKIFEGFLSDQDVKIVSFIRLGEITFSKSDFLNSVLSNDPLFQTFYSWNCPLGSNSKRTLDGTVEASYFVPFGQTKNSFDDVILFLNLRGDAVHYPLLVNVLKSLSNVVVVLQSTNMKNDDKIAETLTSIYQSSASVIIAFESNLTKKEEDIVYVAIKDIAKIETSEFHWIDLKVNGRLKGVSDIASVTKSKIFKFLSNVKALPFSRFGQVLDTYGIHCDYAVQECVVGCQLAAKMLEMITAKSESIQHFWLKISKLKKEKYREKSLRQKRDIEKQIQDIRSQQIESISQLPKLSFAMLKNFYDLKDFPDTLLFFLKSLKLLLDKRSKKILPSLLCTYNDLINNSNKAGSNKKQIEQQIKEIKIKMDDASYGVEHLMREVAQIFEALTSTPLTKNPNFNVLKYVENCPSIAANLLIEGYPLEVMDGAASDIPLIWIENVLTCLESKIGSTAKLLTLSIMGIQSSGKSTLLNAMFGLQLAVSTGRCTKGVFLQLIPMPKDQFPFQYVLVFDTEGLRSNEQRESIVSHAHDNQLATFVVGVADITLINIRGENMSEVSDILEIVVHAFIRMKKVNENFKLKQSCIFVHQDVSDTNAKSNLLPGTLQLVKCLDEITNEAAEQEHLPNCHSFDRIIHFNHEKHVFYFPNLWRGTPPLCAINTEYSENVHRLRRFIMSDISERRKTYFSVHEICSKIKNLWDAILSEDFIFSFRNGIAIKAERAIESKIFELHRKLENTVYHFLMNDAELAFRNCEKEENLENFSLKLADKLSEILSTSFEGLKKEWTDFIETAPLRDIMIQWKEYRLKQLEIFKNEKQESAWKDIRFIESKTRLDIRQRIILTPKEMADCKDHADNLVEKCTEHPLDDDIKSAFENLWSTDFRRFSTEAHVEALSIDDEIWKIVQSFFYNDSIYLTNELEKFNWQQRVKEFEQTRHLKGCIKETDIKTRHLSGDRINSEAEFALTIADDIFSKIDIFIRNRENKGFNIAEIKEIFDIYKKCDDQACEYVFSLSKNFKAMLAVFIWKSLSPVYQQIHDEYEKISGLQSMQTKYKNKLLNNFRKLISEAMKLKTETIRKRKEEEKRKKEAIQAKIQQDEEANRKTFEEYQIKLKQLERQRKLRIEEEERKRIQNEREEKRRQKEYDLKLQAEKKKTEEQERKLKDEEVKRKEQERKLKEEERIREEQDRKLEEEGQKREEQDRKIKDEEQKREEQERKLEEGERKREEQDRKLKDEEQKREEQERKLKEEEQKREEQDRKIKEEEQKREEQERKLEEEEQKREEQDRKLKKMESDRQFKMQEEREREQDRKTALSITDVIDKCIILHISNCLQNKVVTEILQKFEYSKHNLIKALMVSLAEREDFGEFCSYFHSTTSFVNTFVQTFTEKELFADEKLYLKLAESQVRLLINETKDAIKAEGNACILDMDNWSTHISQNLHFINIPIDSPVRFINVSDFEKLTCFIIDYLEKSKDSCISQFRKVSSSSVKWHDGNPYQQIFERLWGCGEKCPFCCEPCQLTTKDHRGPHKCLQHRPDGVSGWHWIKTQTLSLDTCDANVASENVFYCNKNRFNCHEDRNHNEHKFRNYKTFDPSWNIPPDHNLSESKYWAWYLCRFEEQIKIRYNVSYPTLPDDWKKLSVYEAIQSLG